MPYSGYKGSAENHYFVGDEKPQQKALIPDIITSHNEITVPSITIRDDNNSSGDDNITSLSFRKYYALASITLSAHHHLMIEEGELEVNEDLFVENSVALYVLCFSAWRFQMPHHYWTAICELQLTSLQAVSV